MTGFDPKGHGRPQSELPKDRAYRHLFGPVPSRRLGRSLGIDLVPFKTCPYDCVYCQLGPTTVKTIEIQEYFPIDSILEEIDRELEDPHRIDFLTFSGSGEPTLHSGLGRMIRHLKTRSSIPVAVLTNGALFSNPYVREGVLEADVVVPSLDAGDPASFQRINRPHPAIDFHEMVEGLVRLREEYRGEIWLEVFLAWGINSMDPEVERIGRWASMIEPDRIQLNTVHRPPADPLVERVKDEDLVRLSSLFRGRVEILSPTRGEGNRTAEKESQEVDDARVLAMVRRRPCRFDDLVRGLGIHRVELRKTLQSLLQRGAIEESRQGEETFYRGFHPEN